MAELDTAVTDLSRIIESSACYRHASHGGTDGTLEAQTGASLWADNVPACRLSQRAVLPVSGSGCFTLTLALYVLLDINIKIGSALRRSDVSIVPVVGT